MHYGFYQELKSDYKRKYNMSEEDFVQFVSDASVLFKRGYVGSYKDYWNFYHSFWFTTTVVTTMGKFCLLQKFGKKLNAMSKLEQLESSQGRQAQTWSGNNRGRI